MRGGTKAVPPILVSEITITITIIIKFTYIMDIQFTNLRLFFHNVSFIMNTVFLPLCKMLYVDHWKLFDRASKISMHTVFQFVVVWQMASLECILQGAIKMESKGAKSGL
jgi:hypothetical protein